MEIIFQSTVEKKKNGRASSGVALLIYKRCEYHIEKIEYISDRLLKNKTSNYKFEWFLFEV